MGMEIFIIKRKPIKKIKNFYKLSNLYNAVKNKDFIINLLPNEKGTREIFNYKIFKNMSKKSFFINLGRGETVNEKDLEKTVKKNLISGVALDVVKNEPLKKILIYLNIIMLSLPHILQQLIQVIKSIKLIFFHIT